MSNTLYKKFVVLFRKKHLCVCEWNNTSIVFSWVKHQILNSHLTFFEVSEAKNTISQK